MPSTGEIYFRAFYVRGYLLSFIPYVHTKRGEASPMIPKNHNGSEGRYPIPLCQCAWCRSIELNGVWLKTNTLLVATQGICPECLMKITESDVNSWLVPQDASAEAAGRGKHAIEKHRPERRKHTRVNIRVPVKLRPLNSTGECETEDTYTLNISSGGVLAMTSQKLKPGTKLEILLRDSLPVNGKGRQRVFRCYGKVVHTGGDTDCGGVPRGRGVGIAFSERFTCLG